MGLQRQGRHNRLDEQKFFDEPKPQVEQQKGFLQAFNEIIGKTRKSIGKGIGILAFCMMANMFFSKETDAKYEKPRVISSEISKKVASEIPLWENRQLVINVADGQGNPKVFWNGTETHMIFQYEYIGDDSDFWLAVEDPNTEEFIVQGEIPSLNSPYEEYDCMIWDDEIFVTTNRDGGMYYDLYRAPWDGNSAGTFTPVSMGGGNAYYSGLFATQLSGQGNPWMYMGDGSNDIVYTPMTTEPWATPLPITFHHSFPLGPTTTAGMYVEEDASFAAISFECSGNIDRYCIGDPGVYNIFLLLPTATPDGVNWTFIDWSNDPVYNPANDGIVSCGGPFKDFRGCIYVGCYGGISKANPVNGDDWCVAANHEDLVQLGLIKRQYESQTDCCSETCKGPYCRDSSWNCQPTTTTTTTSTTTTTETTTTKPLETTTTTSSTSTFSPTTTTIKPTTTSSTTTSTEPPETTTTSSTSTSTSTSTFSPTTTTLETTTTELPTTTSSTKPSTTSTTSTTLSPTSTTTTTLETTTTEPTTTTSTTSSTTTSTETPTSTTTTTIKPTTTTSTTTTTELPTTTKDSTTTSTTTSTKPPETTTTKTPTTTYTSTSSTTTTIPYDDDSTDDDSATDDDTIDDDNNDTANDDTTTDDDTINDDNNDTSEGADQPYDPPPLPNPTGNDDSDDNTGSSSGGCGC